MSGNRAFVAAAVLAAASALSCAMLPGPRDRGPLEFSGASAPGDPDPFANWPLPPHEAERILSHRDAVLLGRKYAGAGVTGAEKVDLDFPGDAYDVSVKWKPMPRRLDGINNSPRKEIAAYAIQSLYLDAEDYVVPTTVARCPSIDMAGAKPSRPGSRCVLGVAALWLDDLSLPDPFFDPQRFRRDPVYAYYMANFNLLTYLIKHLDGRSGNFLVSKNPNQPRVFAIDNGVAFGGIFYNWFVPNWDDVRVPALRKQSIERLRALERSDLDSLGVVVQLELDDAGIFRSVEPGENLAPRKGVRTTDRVIQLGLTKSEIDDVWERIEDLLGEVDDGEIQVF